jgi:aminopeptidase-like protein
LKPGAPYCRLSRTPHGEYAEYHTSADDRDFISEERLQGALALCQRIVGDFEANQRWRNLAPHGEPQLGKRGLYGGTGGTAPEPAQLALLWMLSFSDGEHSVLDIAERSGMAVPDLAAAAERLYAAGLLAPTREGAGP